MMYVLGTNRLASAMRNRLKGIEPDSPCQRTATCQIRGGMCVGCYRTHEDIKAWRTATKAERWDILLRSLRRRVTR